MKKIKHFNSGKLNKNVLSKEQLRTIKGGNGGNGGGVVITLGAIKVDGEG